MAAERGPGASNVGTTAQPWGTVLTRRVFGEVDEEKRRNADLPERLAEDRQRLASDITEQKQAIAHSVDITTDEINRLLEGEPGEFQNTYSQVIRAREVGATIDWKEAMWVEDFRVGSSRALLDNVSASLNWRSGYGFPRAGVEKLLKKPKKRKRFGKLSMHTSEAKLRIKADYENKKAKRIRLKVTDEMAEQVLNVEKATPLELEGFDPFFRDNQ